MNLASATHRGYAQHFDDVSSSWPGADLFTNGSAPHLQIEIRSQDLEKLKTDSREFVHSSVTEAGTLYPDVGIHLKGSIGSFRPIDDKPGFTLDFSRFKTSQRFHGLRRIHLNNSVEDPSYCNEQLGSELFRAAGIPAPRVTHAIVTLNGRKLGLFVLKEGFTEDFLSCYFKTIGGNLFEPGEGHDVNQHLKRTSIAAPMQSRNELHRLSKTVLQPDTNLRWQHLNDTLDLDRFLRFAALEVMLCHRDGYCLARNNFRVYQDLGSGKFVFFPHGMDQLFGTAELSWLPHMAGLVAQAVLDAPEGQLRYKNTFKTLFAQVLRPDILTNRVNQIITSLRPHLDEADFRNIAIEASSLNQRILARYHYLKTELERPALESLDFTQGSHHLSGWIKIDEPETGKMDQDTGPSGINALHIATSSDTTASWRTKALLPPGRYRFEAKICVQDVKPISFGAHQGVGVRVGGQPRQSPDLVGSSSWQVLSSEFDVTGSPREIEFICELRASSGQAWFDSDSLVVIKEP